MPSCVFPWSNLRKVPDSFHLLVISSEETSGLHRLLDALSRCFSCEGVSVRKKNAAITQTLGNSSLSSSRLMRGRRKFFFLYTEPLLHASLSFPFTQSELDFQCNSLSFFCRSFLVCIVIFMLIFMSIFFKFKPALPILLLFLSIYVFPPFCVYFPFQTAYVTAFFC